MVSTLVSALETRLKHRLGLASTISISDSRVLEAINAGVNRAYADGVPGLSARTLNGYTYASLSGTVAAHSNSSSAVTVASAAYVFPGDILNVNSKDYLIYSVNRSTNVIDVGIPIEASVNGLTYTITRRSIKLPDATVMEVRLRDFPLEANTRATLFEGVDNPGGYHVGYSEGTGETYINLIPAPSAGDEVTIMLRDVKARLGSSDTLDFPEAVFDAILERARQAYLIWSGNIGSIEATLAETAVTDTEGQSKATSAERGARVGVRV